MVFIGGACEPGPKCKGESDPIRRKGESVLGKGGTCYRVLGDGNFSYRQMTWLEDTYEYNNSITASKAISSKFITSGETGFHHILSGDREN